MIAMKLMWRLLKQATNAWVADRATSMGAALAYYMAFSIAPLLIIAIAVAGLIFGRDAAQAAVIAQLGGLLGDNGAESINDILDSNSDFGSSLFALVVGIGALVVAATTAFVELQDDLDRIWKAEPRLGSGLVNLIRSRLLSFGMVLFIGFLLAVSLVLSAAVAAVESSLFTGEGLLLQVASFAISFAIVTMLFAMIYKVLPNVKIAWEEVWIGAATTALLFTIGKELIGVYIGKSSIASSFGAAGPFVVLMLWIYYSTQIFLFGAEFTFAYAHRNDPAARPAATPAATPNVPTSGAPSLPSSPPSDPLPLSGNATEVSWPRSSGASPAAPLAASAAGGLLTGFLVTRLVRQRLAKLR